MKCSPHAVWIHEKVSPQHRTFSNEPFHIKGKIQTTITNNGWTSNSATFTVIADSLNSFIGRDLFDHLSLAVTQSSSVQGNQVNTISSTSEFKEHIAQNFPNLISRIGRSKNLVAVSNFHKDFQPRHQKGRRTRVNLQDKVNMELKKVLDEKHIIKLSSCPDKYFISPIVVTVRKNQSIKLALDSKILTKAILKTNIKCLILIRASNLFLNRLVLPHPRRQQIFHIGFEIRVQLIKFRS